MVAIRMKCAVAICVLALSASAVAQQPGRISDAEINKRFELMVGRIAQEVSVAVALQARVELLEAESARLREEIEKAKSKQAGAEKK